MFECYAGAVKNISGKGALGILLVKCFLQGILVYLLMILPFLSTCWLVTLFGNDKKVHDITVLCIKLMCLRPLLIYFRDLLIKFMVVQDYMFVSLAITVICVPLSVFLDWLAVMYFQWGIYGLVGAQYVTVCSSLILIIAFAVWKRKELDFPVLNLDDVLQGWGEMVKLGMFSGLRSFASFALYAIAIVISQTSGTVTAAANVVIAVSTVMFHASVYGGAYAQALLVGEALGKGNKEDVKFVLKLGMWNLLLDRIVVVGVFLASIRHIAQLLSYGDNVIDEVIQANGSVVTMFLLFGLDEYLSRGILTPFAKQAVIAIVTPASIYLLAVPLLFAMVKLYHIKAYAVILCESSCYVVQCLVYIVVLYRIDIDDEIVKCRERNVLTEETTDNSQGSNGIVSYNGNKD